NYLFGELIVRLSQAWRAACGPEAEMRIAVFGDEATIVETDADLLIAIGNYLVSNASKFTVLAPQIYISLRLESQQLRIAFNDNGIGVPAGEEELIFNIFYRGSNVDQQRGMGLGLFSARKISQALQGNLVLAESSVAGSSFVLTVPISAHHNLAHPVEMMAA
ncbi:MAG: ATP-binding protein, partial [Anaerolineales bacterium]|nr:ATP-binding protein [Anaerolineales bacterium]